MLIYCLWGGGRVWIYVNVISCKVGIGPILARSEIILERIFCRLMFQIPTSELIFAIWLSVVKLLRVIVFWVMV
jgi:hypothetical protein